MAVSRQPWDANLLVDLMPMQVEGSGDRKIAGLLHGLPPWLDRRSWEAHDVSARNLSCHPWQEAVAPRNVARVLLQQEFCKGSEHHAIAGVA